MPLSIRRDPGAPPVEAYVFADGFADYPALAADLDAEFGRDSWKRISILDASRALRQRGGPPAIAVFAVASEAAEPIERVARLIRRAHEAGMPVLLVVGELSPRAVHRLVREGVAEFTPYPDPEGALPEAIRRVRLHGTGAAIAPYGMGAAPTRRGRLISAYGVAGGVGASTFVVNLAAEIANAVRDAGGRVALLDFNFQYGSVGTYLGLPRGEAIYELVSDAASLDGDGLARALSAHRDGLHVLTAPLDSLPLDIVSPGDVEAVIRLARESFDVVLIDMPQALMNWFEPVYLASDEFYAVMEAEMRSAQNMLRLLRVLKAEDMPLDRLRFVLNRAPGLMDLGGKQRVRKLAASLDIAFDLRLPDGGRQVTKACDAGTPLAEAAKSNPLRKEIAKLARSLLASGAEATARRPPR